MRQKEELSRYDAGTVESLTGCLGVRTTYWDFSLKQGLQTLISLYLSVTGLKQLLEMILFRSWGISFQLRKIPRKVSADSCWLSTLPSSWGNECVRCEGGLLGTHAVFSLVHHLCYSDPIVSYNLWKWHHLDSIVLFYQGNLEEKVEWNNYRPCYCS